MDSYPICKVSETKTETFDPYAYDNPIHPERFGGLHETQLGKVTG